ncbi:MAG TPA: TonB-dependent receptor [Candidatus Dormibacteraeota bacterium]|nr:TonB-dependent receptor [Candidatus Dormibacteraeota bacterium]
MFRILAALFAALSIEVATFAFAFAVAGAATTGLVRGTVTLDGAPAPRARVTLVGEGSRFVATTDAHGVYVFSTVPFGDYLLTAHADSALARSYTLSVSSDSIVTVDVALSHLHAIAHATVAANAGVTGTPVGVNQIDRSAIQASPDENDLNRLIETMPGIVRFSYDEPVALGFHGVTYNIDGAPLPLATSSNFAQIVDPADIDSIEIYTGDFPAEYGGERMGALVNVITDRSSDIGQGNFGRLTEGVGNYGQAIAELADEARSGSTEVFLDVNTQQTNYGIDAPTYVPIHDNSSSSDEFLRAITQIDSRSTLAFDYGNQFSQFEIPINADPSNPLDPVTSAPGTDDVQREYDRFASANYTLASRDGSGVFQVIPWYRMTRVVYAGDLANDVLATQFDPNTGTLDHLVGLDQDRLAAYAGIRVSDFRATGTHAWKIGIDADRENFTANETFACYYVQCNSTLSPVSPYYPVYTAQARAGSAIGLYAQDTWTPIRILSIQYGLRYDRSTGYVGGDMLEPRIAANLQADPKNIVHVYYGRFYAAPQLEDVRQACALLGAGSGGCPANPVYNLQPERDAYFEMGLQHAFSPTMTGYVNLDERNVINVLDTTQLLNTPLFAVFNNALGRYTGVEMRLEDRLENGNSWYVTTTVSSSQAGGISGSTFLFGPAPNPPGVPLTSPELLSPEDHDQTVASTAGYTARFGPAREWYATLQGDYGTGYPVAFENATTSLSGRLPSHLAFDASLGRTLVGTPNHGLGVRVDVENLLNHQYVLKIANGFNTTQIAPGRSALVRLTEAF